jgi:D-amino-acid dehydrogenase
MTTDTIVLGAGIIGVSAALHLQARGRAVLLVDRRGPGEETSHGNAGLIERASVVPYAFPRDLASMVRYGFNQAIDASFHWGFLPRIAPWLLRYWHHSAPARLAGAARAMLPLIERCVAEHDALTDAAGTAPLLRRTGWIEVYRDRGKLDRALAEAAALAPYGLAYDALDGGGLRALEPALAPVVAGGVHWRDPVSVVDPGAVTRAYAELFVRRGGRIARGDAASLTESGGWSIATADGIATARDTVVALGPWSDTVFRPLGYRWPLAVKRGYHMHYQQPATPLTRPLLDGDNGFVLSPMTRGVRLTSGVEFAPRDAAPTPVQLDRAEPKARELLALGARVDGAPWMGCRPALPDMRPVIGPAPRHRGLWFAFGHAHHGFTLGPVTGRLLAELITGAAPVVDPAPYSAARFG